MKLEILECLPKESPKSPPLLFLHGASHGAWCWKENFLPYFAQKGYAAYALSFRGHGDSEGYENLHAFTLKDYLNDALEVIPNLKRKPVLIGHSMGGTVVQMILHRHPDKIKAAVLMASNPPQGMAKDLWRMIFISLGDVIRLARFNKGKKGSFPAEKFFSQKLPDEKKDEYSKLMQPESNLVRKELLKRNVPETIDIKVPILVLGSKKDRWFSEKTTASIGKTYKTKPVIFADVSHDMMLDPNWRMVADEVLNFLHASRINKKIK